MKPKAQAPKSKSERRKCGVCGRFYPIPLKAIGRPSLYCGAACRDVSSCLSTLESRLIALTPAMTDAAYRTLRSTLWRMGNGRGVNDLTEIQEQVRAAGQVRDALEGLGAAGVSVERARVSIAGAVVYVGSSDRWMDTRGDLREGGCTPQETAKLIWSDWTQAAQSCGS